MIPFANRGGCPVKGMDLGPLSTGDVLDRCRILGLLGRGGFAAVYKGLHTGLDQPRALKVLLDLGDSEEAGDIKQRFLMATRHIARLWHPNHVTPGTGSKCSKCGAPMSHGTRD